MLKFALASAHEHSLLELIPPLIAFALNLSDAHLLLTVKRELNIGVSVRTRRVSTTTFLIA